MWRRDSRRFTGLPREHCFRDAGGMRFVRNTPAIQHAMIRTIAFSIPPRAMGSAAAVCPAHLLLGLACTA